MGVDSGAILLDFSHSLFFSGFCKKSVRNTNTTWQSEKSNFFNAYKDYQEYQNYLDFVSRLPVLREFFKIYLIQRCQFLTV